MRRLFVCNRELCCVYLSNERPEMIDEADVLGAVIFEVQSVLSAFFELQVAGDQSAVLFHIKEDPILGAGTLQPNAGE
jgi:hypothetical protein